MICNLNTPYSQKADFEPAVRHRMQQDQIPQQEFPYLAAKPYPEPECLRQWLREQHEHASNTYLIWKGWVLFKHEADAVAFTLTYPVK
jgi:hypothetical protein